MQWYHLSSIMVSMTGMMVSCPEKWLSYTGMVALNLRTGGSICHGILNYINDYRINVIEVSYLTEEQIALFQSEFKVVANFFVKIERMKQLWIQQKSSMWMRCSSSCR